MFIFVIIPVKNNSLVLNSLSVDHWELTWCRPMYFCSVRLTYHTNKTSEVSLSMMDEPGGPQGKDIDITAGQHPDSRAQPVCGADKWGALREVLNHGYLSPIRIATLHAAGMEGVHWQASASEQSPEAWMGRIPAEFLRCWDYFLLRWLMRRNESAFCSVYCWCYHSKLFKAKPNFTVCFKAFGTSWHFHRMSIKYI